MKTFIFLLLFLGLVSTTNAQESQIQIPQSKEEIQLRLETKKQTLQTQITQKRQEIKDALAGSSDSIKLPITAQERVSKATAIIFDRLEAFIIRYDGLIQRLETRISNTPESDTKIKATQLLLDAKINLNESTTLILATRKEIEDSLLTKTSLEIIKTNVEICRASLKKTHDALLLTIRSIKAVDEENTLSLE
jgi:hypothetical protein